MRKLIFAAALLTFASQPAFTVKQSRTVTLTLTIGVANGSHWLRLDWPNSVSPNVAGYNVYCASGVILSEAVEQNQSLITGNTFTLNAVKAGATYTCSVRSVDTAGREGIDSKPAQATIPTP